MQPIYPTIFPCLQDSLLGDGFLAGASGSPSGLCALYPVPLPSFPCFADEMEEQAKAMEYDYLASAAAQDPLKAQQQNIPALRALRSSSEEGAQQRTMVPINSLYPGGSRTAGGPSHLENHQQQQKKQQQQQQQQTLAATLQPPSSAGGGAPLAAALHNADCIRSGFRSPWTGGWLGCRSGPWCNREKGHIGQCNTRATIPGLSAYLPEELAAVGLPAVVELTAPLPPAAAAVALAAATAAATVASGGAAAADVMTGLGRRTVEVGAGGTAATALSSGDSLTASDNNSYNDGDEAEQQHRLMAGQGGRASARSSKRKKAAGGFEVLLPGTNAGAAPGELMDAGANTDNEAVSEELKSSMTGEAKLRSVASPTEATKFTTGGKKGGKKQHGRKGKKYNKGRRKTALPLGVHFAADPSEPMMISGDGQMNSQMPTIIAPGFAAAAPPGALGTAAAGPISKSLLPRAPNGRRAPQVWISGECTDPRTGMLVSIVPPASFCTQCSATSTPVWRAGPFGHKTLCNACGVRWMKVAPRSRK